MSSNIRKKTDIQVPEPRHRVGPKGVSSGISFRDLPPASLEEIKNVCDHYKEKCEGTYKSLASRYVYQMATEIDQLVEALKDSSMPGLVTQGQSYDFTADGSTSSVSPRETVRPHSFNKNMRPMSSNRPLRNNRDKMNVLSFNNNQHHGPRPRTAAAGRRPSHLSRHHRRNAMREYPFDLIDAASEEIPVVKPKHFRSRQAIILEEPAPRRHHHHHHRHHHHRSTAPPRRRDDSSLAHHNLEDQNEEVLRWLKEEMRRSQSLIDRSKQIHDAELVGAKKEVEKVKKAAKVLIKAARQKGTAKSEAAVDIERRRRLRSQQMLESLIETHNAQVDALKKGRSRGDGNHAWFYPWGELQDDRTEVSFNHSYASDLTTVLDDLAEETYQQSSIA